MRRWIITAGLAALLAAVLLIIFAFPDPEPVSTQDIDAIDHYMNGSLRPATFVPGVPREEVLQKAIESAGRVIGGQDTSTLVSKATVGLYTLKDEEGNWVEGRKAWLVVVDGLPVTFPSGPYTSPENRVDRSGQRQQNQLVIFFDPDTGEEIEGSISGRWVED